ncbi:response regulator [Pseudomonas sp. DB1]|uniref:Response regulator n=1 Tax=Metapseudomonas boanensis TaxID=2822138 RepID=A0ABS5XBS7_9GAMM|nr:response regulator [Pseudomonas boanensis]
MPAAKSDRVVKLEVLVVEDHPFQLIAVEMLLNQPGDIRLTQAMNAHEARQACREHQAPFDLLLCDQRLPDSYGLELLEELFCHGHIHHGIILSSATDDELDQLADRAKSRRLPLLACLPKPLDLNQFKALTAQLLG